MFDGVLQRQGRTLAVRYGGAEDGPLVVHLHGAPGSRLDVDELDACAKAHGVRVVAVDRPGYGGSEYHPYTFESVAQDVAAVADSLGAERFHVTGQSAGCAYALGVAALFSQRIVSVAIVGSGAPYLPEVAWYETLDDDERRGIALIGTDDEEAARLLALPDLPYSDNARTGGDDEILRQWLDMLGPADRKVVERKSDWLLASVRESQRPGILGWARDNVVRMGRWSFDAAEVRAPVTIWFGGEDAWAPVNWLLPTFPTASAHIVAARGHLLLFDDPTPIFADLLAATP